ncbi:MULTISPECIES: class 1 fructose-bisphosphatase [Pseudoalteromonas]|uniref:Class 1 fructose-bisphosphatase n=1 Tax=Pseudoalteromonas undina TaxID=43660 RepID=A0ACC6R8B2_9GAMM|nr:MULTISPECIES: class 1 fructose-bisphosphatase [unclassified Pseudoalteromonas]KPZ52006.1 Fructose-1,6-bisphosphatase class 1 [Pseudoalteromonas sp. P1-25]KPZ52672.1 Fructose-1,6-bisphosphatase class 1 [Pseudoalteromonas sp. P1-13-1a]KPZ54481.1 Fructose-1,6-bisphosphatase class 1 [Pseudoalteromonas sp. P1-7a]
MKRLNKVLKEDGVETDLIMLIRTLLATTKEIAFRVSQGELAGVLGSTLNENIQGEVQKKLDVIANQLLKDTLIDDELVKTVASEEEDNAVGAHPDGKYIVAFDPLDGSSNIDVNGQIGTIFTIYPAKADVPYDSDEQFNQPGTNQVCAGYVLYGPSSLLVMTTGGPTRCYTHDLTHGGFLLTKPELKVSSKSREFSVNMANYRYWDEATQVYFDKLLYTSEEFAKSSIRYNAAMVGDVHRILCRGGVFMYPQDTRSGNENGKIRLLYEANPLAMLTENAGGIATSKGMRILDIHPEDLHQRVPVILGSSEPVAYFNSTVY